MHNITESKTEGTTNDKKRCVNNLLDNLIVYFDLCIYSIWVYVYMYVFVHLFIYLILFICLFN